MTLLPFVLLPLFTKLFNNCLITKTIPDDWKSAVVSPIYKNKGEKSDPNSYRGISVLSPVAKLFEKVLAKQITEYLEKNYLFSENQHGFRKGHSCETALHELISYMNVARDKKLTTILLFIDFRKAFDTCDTKLLLLKSFHYGFDNNSIYLVANYFEKKMPKH